VNLRRGNLKRLASLSALGAGAFAGAGAAEASSIVYSGTVDEHVGVTKGMRQPISFLGPGGAAGILRFSSFCPCSITCLSCYVTRNVQLSTRHGAHGTNLEFLDKSHNVDAVARGADWRKSFDGQSSAAGKIAGWLNTFNNGGIDSFTQFTSQDRYVLFRFGQGALVHDDYGWAELSVRFTKKTGGPDVTLVAWAYDTSGAEIRAGETGLSGSPAPGGPETPEPSTFALSGLAALALGAKGTRSWRAARKALDESRPGGPC